MQNIMPIPTDAPAPDFGNASAVYEYRNAEGLLNFYVLRFDKPDGSKSFSPLTCWHLPDGAFEWRKQAPPAQRPLYGLELMAQRPDATVLIAEGEKAANAARGLFPDYVCITTIGGAAAANQSNFASLTGRKVTIWPDNDEAGSKYAHTIAKLAYAAGAAECRVVNLPPTLPQKWDVADPLPNGFTADDLAYCLENAVHVSAMAAKPKPRLQLIDASVFSQIKIPPYECILPPWLPKNGIVMLYATRGLGKSMLALKLSCALSLGQEFLGCQPTRLCNVVYVDGEMPASLIQQRLRQIAGQDINHLQNLKILSTDLMTEGTLNLMNAQHRQELEEAAGNYDLMVIDNLSTLYGYENENEAASWAELQEWLLRQRRRGKCVLLVHHANKNGSQRGTSAREVVLDTIINLKKCPNVTANNETYLEWHFEKQRSFYGKDAEPFMVSFGQQEDGAMHFARGELALGNEDITMLIKSLKNQGDSYRTIAEKTGVSKSAVQRLCDA